MNFIVLWLGLFAIYLYDPKLSIVCMTIPSTLYFTNYFITNQYVALITSFVINILLYLLNPRAAMIILLIPFISVINMSNNRENRIVGMIVSVMIIVVTICAFS
jgi:hypothetical protein